MSVRFQYLSDGTIGIYSDLVITYDVPPSMRWLHVYLKAVVVVVECPLYCQQVLLGGEVPYFVILSS